MLIDLNKNDFKRFEKLVEQIEKNKFNAEINNLIISNKDMYFNKQNINNSLKINIKKYLNESEEINVYLDQTHLKELNLNSFLDNDYVKAFKNISFIKDDYKLEFKKYKPYEIFISDDIEIKDNYKEITNLGYFNNEFQYLTLSYKNEIWMLITPNEINTMSKQIAVAKGNVLTFGLGLGYYQFMISLKENVNNIYIVEKDKNIIDIFSKFILPRFQYKNKIKIINEDALIFIKKDILKYNFDFLFLDLYHNPNDGLEFYLRFKILENKFPQATFSYWLNDSLLSLIRRIFINFLIEQYEGLNEKYYNKIDTIEDQLMNYFYKTYKNKTISSYNELSKLLLNDNLNYLIKNFKFIK